MLLYYILFCEECDVTCMTVGSSSALSTTGAASGYSSMSCTAKSRKSLLSWSTSVRASGNSIYRNMNCYRPNCIIVLLINRQCKLKDFTNNWLRKQTWRGGGGVIGGVGSGGNAMHPSRPFPPLITRFIFSHRDYQT